MPTHHFARDRQRWRLIGCDTHKQAHTSMSTPNVNAKFDNFHRPLLLHSFHSHTNCFVSSISARGKKPHRCASDVCVHRSAETWHDVRKPIFHHSQHHSWHSGNGVQRKWAGWCWMKNRSSMNKVSVESRICEKFNRMFLCGPSSRKHAGRSIILWLTTPTNNH